jgi:hypothetical protein
MLIYITFFYDFYFRDRIKHMNLELILERLLEMLLVSHFAVHGIYQNLYLLYPSGVTEAWSYNLRQCQLNIMYQARLRPPGLSNT